MSVHVCYNHPDVKATLPPSSGEACNDEGGRTDCYARCAGYMPKNDPHYYQRIDDLRNMLTMFENADGETSI